MKTYNSKFLWIAAVSLAFASCADDELQPFQAEEPENIHQLDYLDAYGPLKSYVDRAANPGFKLGVAVDEAGFIDKGVVYSMASSNFEDITPGNAMKHSSVVNAEGEMDFTTVKELIETAKGAGMSIYGHTLCWHSQQQADYLNGLIADKVLPDDPSAEPVKPSVVEVASIDYSDYTDYSELKYYDLGYSPDIEDGILKSTSTSSSRCQFFALDGIPTVAGDDYKITVRIKASTAGSMGIQFGDWDAMLEPRLNFTTEWNEVSLDLNGCTDDDGSSFLIFQPWDYEGTIEVEWIKVDHVFVPETEDVELESVWKEDFEDGNIDGWGGWGGNNPARSISAQGEGANGTGYALKVSTSTSGTAHNGAQTQYKYNFAKETTYRLKFKVKGSSTGKGEIVAQNDGEPSYSSDTFEALITGERTFDITTGWTDVEMDVTITAGDRTNLLLNTGTYSGDVWFDDFELYEVHPANVVEIPEEEKKELIRAALENFIKGMMEACGGYVKVWDVVNEPMSDDNPSALKGEKFSKRESNDHFYWQDYLGEDYARYAVEYARKYFKEYGGNEEELLLFVNDYNLEASYNSNAKCEGLINMVKKWESDGVTRIDGIGTQLHVSYSISPTQQKRNEECIVKMFELLAASGKKIKISEIDLGLTDANGDAIVSTNPPLIHQLGQAEYYNFIIRKYFEIIPAEQRYGITLWSMTDSPNTEYSFWRKGEPIGLWDLNYNRKPAYAGFAEGLAGKDAPVPEEYSYLFTEEAAEGGE